MGGRPFSSGTLRQPLNRLAAQPHIAPLIQKLGAHGAIEINRRRIPVQNLPLQPLAALLHGDRSHAFQQRLANAQSAKLRQHKQVLKVDARPAHPRGVVVEKQREAGRLAVVSAIRQEKYGLGPNPSRKRPSSVATTASGARSNVARARIKARICADIAPQSHFESPFPCLDSSLPASLARGTYL